jgi:hypothetical protein
MVICLSSTWWLAWVQSIYLSAAAR